MSGFHEGEPRIAFFRSTAKTSTFFLFFTISGCAYHYVDEKSGIEHVYGFGHLMIKHPSADLDKFASVSGTDLYGLSVGRLPDGGYFSLGFSRRRAVEILAEDGELSLGWSSANLESLQISDKWMGEDLSSGRVSIRKEP